MSDSLNFLFSSNSSYYQFLPVSTSSTDSLFYLSSLCLTVSTSCITSLLKSFLFSVSTCLYCLYRQSLNSSTLCLTVSTFGINSLLKSFLLLVSICLYFLNSQPQNIPFLPVLGWSISYTTSLHIQVFYPLSVLAITASYKLVKLSYCANSSCFAPS